MAVSIFGDGEITGLDSFSLSQDVLASVPTNGLYLSATNTVGIATNGSGRLFVDSSGRVGIGNASPGALLHVGGTQTPTVSAAPTAIRLDNTFTGSPAANTKLKFYLYNDGAEYYGLTVGDAADFQYWAGGAATGIHRWFTSQTERARIDSSGRLLVGTSTANADIYTDATTYTPQLQIKGTNTSTSSMSLMNVAGAGPILYLNAGSTIGALSNDSFIGGINFNGWDGLGYKNVAQIEAFIDATPAANDMPGRLVFSTTADGASSPTERMRISNNGTVAINATSNLQQLNVTHSGRDGLAISDTNTSSIQANLLFSNTRAGGTSNFYIVGYSNSVQTLIVYSNGNIQNTNNSYGAISDIKLKENIVDASSQWDDLKALQVRKYNFKEGQTHTQIGLIAQEAELVSPGLITESPDRDEEGNDLGTVTKSVNYSVLYMKAVKALQEAMERIETLEAKVAALATIQP